MPIFRAAPAMTTEPASEDERGGSIVSVERALWITELLSDASSGMSLADLARHLKVNKAIAHKLLATLDTCGYVFRHEQTGQWCLTYKVSNLGLRQLSQTRLLDQSSVILRSLADATGELVRLAVVEGHKITWVAAAVGQKRTLQIDPNYSLEISLQNHAAGKAWLSTMPFERALPLILENGLAPMTKYSLTSIEAIRADLERSAERGYATSFEEAELGVGTVAAPVIVEQLTGSGICVGTISLAAPTNRMSKADLEACASVVITSAKRLASLWPIAPAGSGPAKG